MVREDIFSGLKNAIERGYSLELAKQSFISAGYPVDEVEAAARYIKSGATELIAPPAVQEPELPVEQEEPSRHNSQELSPIQQTAAPITHYLQKLVKPAQSAPIQKPTFSMQKPKKPFPWKIAVLIGVLVVLVIILILTVVMRDKILGLFS